MTWFQGKSKTPSFQEANLKAREADLPRRLAVLTPEAVRSWIEVIERAAPLVAKETPERPCSYDPWRKALATISAPVQPEVTYSARFADSDSGLINFASDASTPGWPDDCAHLVEFALHFLEADVMLFRSGYTKRHFLRRLRQVELSPSQKDRVVALIKRAVTHGSGLEEFREFERIAVSVADGALVAWLEEKAEGAMVTAGAYRGQFVEVFLQMHEAGKWKEFRSFPGPVNPMEIDIAFFDGQKSTLPDDNCIKVNAWRILRHLFVAKG